MLRADSAVVVSSLTASELFPGLLKADGGVLMGLMSLLLQFQEGNKGCTRETCSTVSCERAVLAQQGNDVFFALPVVWRKNSFLELKKDFII